MPTVTPVRQSAPRGAKIAPLRVGARLVPLHFSRNCRARRYILRVKPDGSAHLTIPRWGSRNGAEAFARRNLGWIDRQLSRPPTPPIQPALWRIGSEIFYRGQPARITPGSGLHEVQFADQTVREREPAEDWRRAIERHLWRVAERELVARTLELAAVHGLKVNQVRVRNQRSRWGSCSVRASISLNWRLIQAPAWVADYLIVHELMHLYEMNHSRRYWRRVEAAFSQFTAAEKWLDAHAGLLR